MHDDNAGAVGVRVEIIIIDDPLSMPALCACMTEKERSAFVTLTSPLMQFGEKALPEPRRDNKAWIMLHGGLHSRWS